MHRYGGVFFTLLPFLAPLPAVVAQSDNVLLVMIDDLGPEYVGCYQRLPNPPATPVMDQLAAGGIRFDNAIANPLCTPSRVCLQTGRHAWRAKTVLVTYPGDPGLADAEILLPEVLAGAGYARGMVGKWHMGDRHGIQTPNVQGWPFFSGQMYGGLNDYYNWPKVKNGVASTSTRYATSDEVDEALAWIQAQPANQPWLMLLCFHSPHGVHHAPPANLHHQNLQGLDPVADKIPFYKAMIEAVDAELGRLLQGIAPQRARTNILLFGDNGTPGEVNSFGLPRERCKGSLYRTGERIPFVANGPMVVQPGRVVTDSIHVLDVFPTVLELCGVNARTALPAGHVLDGQSLTPLLQNRSRPETTKYVENIGTGWGNGAAVSGGGFRLIRFTDDQNTRAHEELYDLRTDPVETRDLLQQPLSPGMTWVYQQLSAAIRSLTHSGFGLVYGDGCPGTYGPVRLMMMQPPNLGAQVYFRVQTPGGAPGPLPVMVVAGPSNLDTGVGPAPFDLSAYGMPGCRMLTQARWHMFSGLTNDFWWVRVPNDPGLIGKELFLQGWVGDPGTNAMRTVTTAGYRIFIDG
ncbi:MAG: sulfatase-like hydrolase/transferase [Planctomycetota bacterium]